MIALDVIKSFFRKGVAVADLREKMREMEREKSELRYDQRRIDKERAEAFERTKRARLRADNAEVMYHLQELKGLDTENRLILRDLTRINKALIILGHYARRLERLERRRDTQGIVQFIERFRTSPALAGLEEADMNEEMLQEMLDEQFAELDRELGLEEQEPLDERSRELLDAIDSVIEAERTGDEETARRLKQRLEIRDEEIEERMAEEPPERPLEAGENTEGG